MFGILFVCAKLGVIISKRGVKLMVNVKDSPRMKPDRVLKLMISHYVNFRNERT